MTSIPGNIRGEGLAAPLIYLGIILVLGRAAARGDFGHQLVDAGRDIIW